MAERCITCYRPADGGKPCPCGCGRLVCSHCGAPKSDPEPTATQLYNAVKAKRYDRDAENPILTIPEIASVLEARAEYVAGAAGPQATPDQESENEPLDEAVTVESNDRWLAAPGQSYLLERMLDCVPGTRVRVVAVPTDPEDHGKDGT